MNRRSFFTLSCLFLLLGNDRAQVQAKNGRSNLPDVVVYAINGVPTTLHQLAKNKVLFIDCWFIPCPPCFAEMGVLHKVYAEYAGNKDFCFITICMTDSGQVKAFIRQDTVMNAYVSQYQWF